MPVHGILVREHPLGQEFRQPEPQDRLGCGRRNRVEVTPGEDGDAQGCEKPWGGESHLRARILTGDVSVAIVGIKTGAKAGVAPGSKDAKVLLVTPGTASTRVLDLPVEVDDLLMRLSFSHHRNIHGEDVAGVKASPAYFEG